MGRAGRSQEKMMFDNPEEEGGSGPAGVWRRAFHAEGTASAKASGGVCCSFKEQEPGSGWKGVSEAEGVMGVEIKRKYFAKGNQ